MPQERGEIALAPRGAACDIECVSSAEGSVTPEPLEDDEESYVVHNRI